MPAMAGRRAPVYPTRTRRATIGLSTESHWQWNGRAMTRVVKEELPQPLRPPSPRPPPLSSSSPRLSFSSTVDKERRGRIEEEEEPALAAEVCPLFNTYGNKLLILRKQLLAISAWEEEEEDKGEEMKTCSTTQEERRSKKKKEIQEEELEVKCIHDMRVVLRRSCTSLSHLSPILDTSSPSSSPLILPVFQRSLKALAPARDVDVMIETLMSVLGRIEKDTGKLNKEERELLSWFRAKCSRIRRKSLQRTSSLMRKKKTKRAIAALRKYRIKRDKKRGSGKGGGDEEKGGQTVSAVAPLVLASALSHALLHPGWNITSLAVREEEQEEEEEGSLMTTPLGLDSRRCETMHSLRKRLRIFRYMLDIFCSLEPIKSNKAVILHKKVEELISMQKALGDMNDIHVLSIFLLTQDAPQGQKRKRGEKKQPCPPRVRTELRRLYFESWRCWLEQKRKCEQKALFDAVLSPLQ